MKVLLHSCGQNRAILDDLIDCGVSAFQFDQPTVYDLEGFHLGLAFPVDFDCRHTVRFIHTLRGGSLCGDVCTFP